MTQDRPAGLDSWLWRGPLAAHSFGFGFTGGRRAPELRVHSMSHRNGADDVPTLLSMFCVGCKTVPEALGPIPGVGHLHVQKEASRNRHPSHMINI